MKQALTLLFLSFFSLTLTAQTVTKRIVIANGGQFGNPQDDVNISLYNPENGTYQSIDTIHTQSMQDILIDGRDLYVAAQDSIVKYDLVTGKRLAANAFGAPSTISMALYEGHLLVGNWYAPFGQVGPYRNHFRVFDKHSLAFVDSIPEIHQGVKSLVVLGDTAYISQNYTSSAFTDSAGWLVKVHLPTLAYVDSVKVNDNGEDLGRLVTDNGIVFGLNSESNTVTMYDPATGMVMTDTANANLDLGGYGSKLAKDQSGTIHTILDGRIGTYDPVSRSVIQENIVDTVVTAFALDTVNQLYYVTQTDFFSYTQGGIYDTSGAKTGSLTVGSAPEAVGVAYNRVPVALGDTLVALQGVLAEIPVTANDSDLDGDSLLVRLISYTQRHFDTLYTDNTRLMGLGSTIGTDTLLYEIVDEWGDTDTAVAFVFVDSQQGISGEFPAEFVTVSPVPATSELRFAFDAEWSGHLRLFSMQGQLVLSQEILQKASGSLELSLLPPGVYFLQGINEDGFWQKKIVKQ